MPAARPVPVPTISVSEDAAGEATPIPGGVRVTFGPGKADLNPATTDALRLQLGHTLKPTPPNGSINVQAYATGTPDDPSTPRRISLSRALAARAVLMSEGLRLHPHLPCTPWAPPAGGPTDRVDVHQVGAPPAPP